MSGHGGVHPIRVDGLQPSAEPAAGAPAVSARAALALIAAGALVALVLAVVSAPQPVVPTLPLVAHLSGLLAGYGVTVMVVLMARVPALERGVGADRLTRWHRAGGRLILVSMLVHAVAATVAWAQVRGEGPVAALREVLGFPGLVAASVGTILFLGVGVAAIRAARRRVRYETWHLLHLSTYLAIALSFPHELAGPDLAGLPVVQVYWSLLTTASFGLVLRYRVLEPLLLLWRHRLRIDRVVDEGNGVTTLVLRGRYLEELDAESGQFFRWRFLTASTWWAAHPFSLSAPPRPDALRLTVKAIGDGTTAIGALRRGTRVLAEGPYGAMTERRRTGRGVLLVAGGVGITPMRALFESLDVEGDRLTLLYRASTEEEILFRDELEHIAERRGARLLTVVGRSSSPANALTAERLLRDVPGLAERDVYLCASPRFATAARASLLAAGVPRARIRSEEFAF